jgi:DNA-binding PadR family transcriptional regulator
MVKQRRTDGGLGRFGDPGVLVLLSLASGPKHGHAMTADILEQAGVRLGPGTLYGSIAKLCERGLIAALPSDDRRLPYEITPAGRAALTDALDMWSKVVTTGTIRLGQA